MDWSNSAVPPLSGVSEGERLSVGKLGSHGVMPILLLLLALQGIYSAHLPLFGDEAYYWAWSTHPGLSYFDHPPMIAWLLRLATLFGTSELAVRMVPILCFGLTAWLIHAMARDIYGPRAGLIALLIFAAMPATQIGVLVATPDAPLMLFWTLSLFLVHRAIFLGGVRRHVLAGVAVGLALLSKYTAILFPLSLLIFLLVRRRDVLKRWESWLAMLLALALTAPVLLWNYQHDWVSFVFQYRHGSTTQNTVHWGGWFEFIAGTALIFSPVLFFMALQAVCERKTVWRDDRRLYLAAFFILPLGFFLYKGLFHKMELNWAAIAFPAATILVAGFIDEHRFNKLLLLGLLPALLLSLAIKFPTQLHLPAKLNLLSRLHGNRHVVEALLKLRRPGEPLLADHYSTASLLSFYAPDHPTVRIPTATRFSQYDLWAADAPSSTPQGLYLSRSDKSKELAQICGRTTLLRTFTVNDPGFTRKTYYFYRCGE